MECTQTALLKATELFQTQSSLIHSQTHSLTHSLTLTPKLTARRCSLPFCPPFVLAVHSPPSFVASFVLCFQVLGSLFFSFFNAIFCFVSWVIVNLISFLFWVLQILDSSNFGFLQVSLVGELNLVLFVFVWVLGINGVIVVVVVGCFLGC